MPKITTSQDPNSTPQIRGTRLRSLRAMTGLSRKQFALQFTRKSKTGTEEPLFNRNTLQAWENPKAKAGGLKEKHARQLIKAFQKLGIQCSGDWLLYGIGLQPQISTRASSQPQVEPQQFDQSRAIVAELRTFRECNPDTVNITITDSGMAPFYQPGDLVAGSRLYGKKLQKLVGYDCIVETEANETLLRRLRPGSKAGVYNLVCINPDADNIVFILLDQKVVSAAPVIWHRRKNYVET